MKKIFLDKKIIMTMLSILLVLSVMMSTTYALFFRVDTLATPEAYTTGDLQISVDKGNVLTLSDTLPISNEDAQSLTPYTFTIKNNGNLTYRFDLKMLSTTSSNPINYKYIKIQIDNDKPLSFGALINGIIKKGVTLKPGKDITIEVRIWLDENTPNTEIGKSFSSKIIADGIGEEEFVEMPFADYIKSLAPETVGWEANASGVFQTPEGDYRYVGAEPNNYVSFNNDLYQVIGVFGKNTHNQDGYLVKLIAANILNYNSWGVYNTENNSGEYSSFHTDWTGSVTGVKASSNVLLNNYFYNKTNSDPTYGDCENWSYYWQNNDSKTKDCTDIIGYGIDNEYKNYIEEARWHLYGYIGSEHSKQEFYMCERGLSTDTENCKVSGLVKSPYSEYVDAKIGLMYVSDYLYASAYFSSTNQVHAVYQTTASHGNQNWLYKGFEWTMTPQGGNESYIFYVSEYGHVTVNNSFNGRGIRPSFYLKSNVYVTSGDGTINNPYSIILK